jgi:hypothetical protein
MTIFYAKIYLYRLFFFLNVIFLANIFVEKPLLYAQIIEDTDSVNMKNIKQHIEFLGSDALQGRGTGTEGEARAAMYISDQLKKNNLTPIGEKESYFQFIPMHGSVPLNSSKLLLMSANEEQVLKLGQDYVLYKTGAQTFIPNPLPLVFAGYGINAPEFDYNDYQLIEVENKIVVFLAGEPYSDDPAYFNGLLPTIYSTPEAKQRMAIARGARGSIMIPNPRLEQGKDWSYWLRDFAFEDVTLAYSVSSNLSIMINPQIAEILFQDAEISLQDVFMMDKQSSMMSFNLKTRISFDGQFSERDFLAKNIIGLLNGNHGKLKGSYLLISAHYDHLGIGPVIEGDSIYNGVFDNAMGVSAVLELARILSKRLDKPKRSIVFLFVTGEEKGLLGSSYYSEHPAVPLYQTVANINVDGLAAFDTFNEVIAIGAEYSSLQDDLLNVLKFKSISLGSIPREYFSVSENMSRSDHYSFAKVGIPFILLMEGLDYKNTTREEGIHRMIYWQKNIYHSPSDDLDQTINYNAVRQHCEILLEFILYLANNPKAPEWRSGTPFINARLQTIAEKR